MYDPDMSTAQASDCPHLMHASALSRALRYYDLRLLVLIAGNRAQAIFERYKVSAAMVITIVVLAIWGGALLGG